MKVLSLIAPLAFSGAVAASWFEGQSVLAGDEKPIAVPGDNPLFYCGNPDDYILDIDKVDLSPNPPKAGQNLTINASGSLSEEVKDGAKVHLTVKWNVIPLIDKEGDLCETLKDVDEECPLKGDLTFKRSVAIPKQVPPGKYTVLADAYTEEGDRITCLKAEVHFP